MKSTVILFGLGASPLAVACSGRNIGPIMARATTEGQIHYAGVIAIFILAAAMSFRRTFRSPALAMLGAQVLIHPSLWVSAYGGDCGAVLHDSSLVYTIVALCAFAWHIHILSAFAAEKEADSRSLADILPG